MRKFLRDFGLSKHERKIKKFRQFREELLDDSYRPYYHFAIPDDIGRPGDPNGAFFARERYHLMYLYERRGVGFCWGHISSSDLLHWRHHPDAIGPGEGDSGCFSGGAYVEKDEQNRLTAYITYWRMPDDRGIGIAYSNDYNFDRWHKFPESTIKATSWGILRIHNDGGKDKILACADPSNIWKKDGMYYMQAGNLPVLNKFGRDKTAKYFERCRGDWVDLYQSEDLKTWEHVHRFYEFQDKKSELGWPDESEDDMCPSFLPLPSSPEGGTPSGKHLQLFISHNRGCQYYIGTYDKSADIFVPESHGRMTWADNTFFAPEALIDNKGRQIMWAWLLDNPLTDRQAIKRGWCGVYGLPRTLWLGEDGTLRFRVPAEFKSLRHNEQSWKSIVIEEGTNTPGFEIDGFDGKCCEIALTIDPRLSKQVGIIVRANGDLDELTRLYCDLETSELVFDAENSSLNKKLGRPIKEKAPFRIAKNEKIQLRVFVDRSVIEIFANDRQAITRRIFPTSEESKHVYLFSKGAKRSIFESVTAWDIMPTNPY